MIAAFGAGIAQAKRQLERLEHARIKPQGRLSRRAAWRYTIPMNKLALIALFWLGLAGVAFAQDRDDTGDHIEFIEPIPEVAPDEASPRPALPRRGASMSEVQREFGPPGEKHPPAGGGSPKHPLITRWDYERFSVFFERNHVIHSVVRDAPATIYHREELQQPLQSPPPEPITQ